ncbi:hypothetical protein [Amycolatopsis sp. cmx-4-61]|uniref:hypothetical protein n=1 Tax=Amycolatopsis sp. cmx-4-61 TaxID=2790937 RepID=UPI00397A3BD1
MKFFIQLADYAQGGAGQKLNAIGLGWTRTTTPLQAHVVVVTAEPDKEDAGKRFKLNVRLVNSDNKPVPDRNGNDISANMEFDVEAEQFDNRAPALTPIILGLDRGLPLEPGFYRWELSLTDDSERTWHRSFQVLEPGVEVNQP